MFNKKGIKKFLEDCKDLKIDEWQSFEINGNGITLNVGYASDKNYIFEIVDETDDGRITNRETEYKINKKTIKRIINWIRGKK